MIAYGRNQLLKYGKYFAFHQVGLLFITKNLKHESEPMLLYKSFGKRSISWETQARVFNELVNKEDGSIAERTLNFIVRISEGSMRRMRK